MPSIKEATESVAAILAEKLANKSYKGKLTVDYNMVHGTIGNVHASEGYDVVIEKK